jgi:hypothetical protein
MFSRFVQHSTFISSAIGPAYQGKQGISAVNHNWLYTGKAL